MKIFSGAPAAVEGVPPVVVMTEGGAASVLDGDFGWGKSLKGKALALAILKAHLGDEYRATQLHTRFQWRTVHEWGEGKPWRITGAEIDAVIKDIEGTAALAKAEAAQVARDIPPVENEGGRGVGGVAFSPIENKG